MLLRTKIVEIMDNLSNNKWKSFETCYAKYQIGHNETLQKNITTIFGNSIKNFSDIKGLYYIDNYLTPEELDALNDTIKSDIEFEHLNLSNPKSRKVAHFGYYYAYNQSGLQVAPAIPRDLLQLVLPNRINASLGENLVDKEFEQLIINKYKPGQCISKHIDQKQQFGPIIACLTIGQSIPIIFRKDGEKKIVEPKPGSLYIMTGESRYEWTHELTNNTNQTRYSLTYRTVNKN
jgi:alkylated DNA repair dioxygenase AlkB